MAIIALDPFLESCVDAFEASLVDAPETDLRRFLPPREHEKYSPVLLELVRVDMDVKWSRGERSTTADYLRLFPELADDRQAIQEIAFGEFRLHCDSGELPDASDFARLYHIDTSDWSRRSDREPFSVKSGDEDTRRFSGDPTQPTARWRTDDLPQVGTCWQGFEIVELLGSGSFGKAYLARQAALANREVVLKFSPLNHREAWRLARLQHAHIVPVLSVHEFGEHCAICLPFAGRQTLVHEEGSRTRADVGSPREAEALKLLSCLSDALDHSHRRGILHGDIKPANILVSDEGEPLLFDFNLAGNLLDATEPRLAGGTLAYMAPEQLRNWLGLPAVVDQRADIFALGVVVYQFVMGRLPWDHAASQDPRAILDDRCQSIDVGRQTNAAISPAFAAILSKCLQPVPENRYQAAAELRDDVGRHLADLPLAVAPNPSRVELFQKWCRRHPRFVSASSAGMLAGFACLVILAAWILRELQHRPVAASAELHNFTLAWDEARADMVNATSVPEWSEATARRAEQLAEQFDLIRPTTRRSASSVSKPAWLKWLSEPQRAEWNENASSLAFMLGSSWFLQAQSAASPELQRESLSKALEFNSLGQRYTPSQLGGHALENQRQRITSALAKLGGDPAAADDQGSGGSVAKATAEPPSAQMDGGEITDNDLWCDQIFGGMLARDDGDLATSERYFRRATQLRPTDATGWLMLADVLRSAKQYASAAITYDVVASLMNDETSIAFQRGLCWLAKGDNARAIDDFSRVVELRPELDSARLNRALAYIARNEPGPALEDLDAALADGCRETRVYFLRARVHDVLGNRAAAENDRNTGLLATPGDANSWIARGVAKIRRDPTGALADFDQALRLDPRAQAARHNQAHVFSEVQQQIDRALGVLDVSLQFDPTDTFALSGRGVLRARRGDWQPALQDAERLLGLPWDAVTRYQTACIYALCVKYDESLRARAESLLAESLRTDPQLVELALSDTDLAGISETEKFRKITAAANELRAAEVAAPQPTFPGADL